MLKLTHMGLLLLLAAACTSPTGIEQPPPPSRGEVSALALNAPEDGFQLGSTPFWIEPGEDLRVCEVVVLPGTAADTYYVPRIEAMLSAQGAELIVYAARPGSDTEAVMDPGARMTCTRAGEIFGEELTEVLSTQNRYIDERFPETTGKVFRGGQKLAVEMHFVNESAEQTLARAKLAFHRSDASRVQRRMRSANFANFTIYTPPGGRSTHVGECVVREEMLVTELVRRTQRYGTSFRVWYAGGSRDGQLAWDSEDRSDARLEFPEALHLFPGEGFRFECSYHNTSSRELRFGVSSSDETCMLQAKYWVPAGGESDDAEGCLLFDVDPDGVARR